MSNLQTSCPVCDAQVTVDQSTVASEIITCPDCDTQLVVDSIDDNSVSVSEAPEVEEDWGE